MDLKRVEKDDCSEKKQIRVWIDGCFDMVHAGHIISIQKSKQLGDHLTVGLLNDEYITQHKGYPVYSEEERYKLVSAIRWVDEVVVGLTHGTDLQTLDKYNMDFCVHGDDVTLNEDGMDPHHDIKKVGKYRCYKRVPGISTTGIIDRILTGVDDSSEKNEDKNSNCNRVHQYMPLEKNGMVLGLDLLQEFYSESKPSPGDRIVYVDGAFDLFHIGHLDILRKAKEEGDFVIVGLHSDSIDIVFHGPVGKDETTADLSRRYEVPKRQGKFRLIDIQNDVTTTSIVNRVLSKRVHYENRNHMKRSKE